MFCVVAISHFIWVPLGGRLVPVSLLVPELSDRSLETVINEAVTHPSPPSLSLCLSPLPSLTISLATPKYELNPRWRHQASVIQSGSPQGQPMIISYTQASHSTLRNPQLPPFTFSALWNMSVSAVWQHTFTQMCCLNVFVVVYRWCSGESLLLWVRCESTWKWEGCEWSLWED